MTGVCSPAKKRQLMSLRVNGWARSRFWTGGKAVRYQDCAIGVAGPASTELGKALESKVFAAAERMRRLLEFIVDHNLRFPGEPLKEITIGTNLYAAAGDLIRASPPPFAWMRDRLRGKLREYYASEGANDSVMIDVPKGSYTPILRAANPAADLPRVASEPSIAVLPFWNLARSPATISATASPKRLFTLSRRCAGIRVVARTSCFALKHRNADVREVGRTLNADFILEGSVRMSGQSLRVTVQLVSAADGFQLWSRRYERNIDDCSPSRTK